jgi:acyl-CoA synthetase (AMP-forming)/AMP-acid ligase II
MWPILRGIVMRLYKRSAPAKERVGLLCRVLGAVFPAMINIENRTIDDVFQDAATRWPGADFLCAPVLDGAPVRTLTFVQTAAAVAAVAESLTRAGYGPGHRAAVLLGTRPEHYIVKLALNRIGMSCVPVNPDYHAEELAYLLEDSGAIIAIADAPRAALMLAAIAAADVAPPFAAYEALTTAPPLAQSAPTGGMISADSEASLLYTSGTTGRPKGCILSHEYELMCGAVYRDIGQPVALRIGGDRILNPLPAFHINAGIVTFFAALLTGNCLIQPERFRASTWWSDVEETRATVFHYLGVVIAVLLADRDAGPEQLSNIRVGFGAGVEPALHVEFERRFGVPLIECWGMTEMCRVLTVDQEPRMIDTRAMGRPRDDLEIMVVDAEDHEVARGVAGEMVLRHSAATPRKGAFSGYLNKPEATEGVWRGGWFHTGDTVTMAEDGMLIFVDRAKNIIRRAGENIAAAEVENRLFADPRVINVACVAAPDEVREEEVMACIVLAPDAPRDEATARSLFDHAAAGMAYFKPPGWVLFVDELPVTGTQKVVKHKIFDADEDPRERPGIFDFRHLKKRNS